jgi:hypothetical protein
LYQPLTSIEFEIPSRSRSGEKEVIMACTGLIGADNENSILKMMMMGNSMRFIIGSPDAE